MTSQTITTDFTTTIFAFDNNDVIKIVKGVVGAVEDVAIDASGAASDNRSFIVDGRVESLNTLYSVALDFDGRTGPNILCNGATIEVGKSGALIAEDIAVNLAVVGLDMTNDGTIRADQAISGTTQGADIVNNGSIIGGDRAVDLRGGDVHFTNNGIVRSDPGDLVFIGGGVVMKLGGGGNVIRNNRVIEQGGDVQVIEFDSFEGTSNLLVNHGRVKGGSTAVVGRDGNEEIFNFGRFDGGVSLNDGNDVLVNRGTIGGTISGGLGDDQLFLYNNKVILGSDAGGFDTVKANISIRLADGIEELTLIGRKDINGTGNDTKNILIGNAGDNVLNGGLQNDGLIGGLGDDRLIGGEGFDNFSFADGFGRDVIADFNPDQDTLNLNDVTSAVDLDTLLGFAHDTTKGVVIDFGLGDRLTLLNIKSDDLDDLKILFFDGGELE